MLSHHDVVVFGIGAAVPLVLFGLNKIMCRFFC